MGEFISWATNTGCEIACEDMYVSIVNFFNRQGRYDQPMAEILIVWKLITHEEHYYKRLALSFIFKCQLLVQRLFSSLMRLKGVYIPQERITQNGTKVYTFYSLETLQGRREIFYLDKIYTRFTLTKAKVNKVQRELRILEM